MLTSLFTKHLSYSTSTWTSHTFTVNTLCPVCMLVDTMWQVYHWLSLFFEGQEVGCSYTAYTGTLWELTWTHVRSSALRKGSRITCCHFYTQDCSTKCSLVHYDRHKTHDPTEQDRSSRSAFLKCIFFLIEGLAHWLAELRCKIISSSKAVNKL